MTRGDDYRRKRNRAGERDRTLSQAGRDIGPPPRVRGKKRRERGREDFVYFCRTYRADAFALKFSPDHLKVAAKIEQAVLRGGLFAVAMPRGSGKTTLCESGGLWALLYGHRRFVTLIGSDKPAAVEMLTTIKTELESNELLLADFPEVCFPIRELEGISHRCKGQLCNGERTHVEWTAQRVVLPTIRGSAASGGVCVVRGLLGRIRGLKHARHDGGQARPDLVIVDDPQTDGSAASPKQCEQREKVIGGAILGLAGPGRKICGLMPCTVIRRGDVADRALDRRIMPDWQGERCKLLYAMPARLDLWDQYAELRAGELEAGRGADAATEFYRRNRRAMDDGAQPAWPERFNDDELSAIQHAMNLYIANPETFAAEYQNEPLDPATAEVELITTDEAARKIGGYKRGEIPTDAEKITAFVDVQAACLFWVLCAWSIDFRGWVLDYGTWPEQPTRYFTLATIRKPLATVYRRAHLPGRIRAGLDDLVGELAAREYRRDDGANMRLDRVLIDNGWEPSAGVIRSFVRESSFRRCWPTFGRGITASQAPMNAWPRKPGDLVGDNWRIPKAGKSPVRHGLYDANHWKTQTMSALVAAVGDPGALALFKARPTEHRMFAEHVSAEYPVETRNESSGRVVREWKLRPGRDNHLFDCLVGNLVAASMEGCQLMRPKMAATKRPPPRRRVRKLL